MSRERVISMENKNNLFRKGDIPLKNLLSNHDSDKTNNNGNRIKFKVKKTMKFSDLNKNSMDINLNQNLSKINHVSITDKNKINCKVNFQIDNFLICNKSNKNIDSNNNNIYNYENSNSFLIKNLNCKRNQHSSMININKSFNSNTNNNLDISHLPRNDIFDNSSSEKNFIKNLNANKSNSMTCETSYNNNSRIDNKKFSYLKLQTEIRHNFKDSFSDILNNKDEVLKKKDSINFKNIKNNEAKFKIPFCKEKISNIKNNHNQYPPYDYNYYYNKNILDKTNKSNNDKIKNFLNFNLDKVKQYDYLIKY